jgi:general secretion pathway protein A
LLYSFECADDLRHLLRAHSAGRRVVLIVDEAQNLTPELLERVRLLTNLETETQKLLQIILIGQPELREMLARNDLRQLAQRITGRYHLDPLSREETAAYVTHRLRIAGATREIFTNGAIAQIHRASGGIPRLINIIGDRALLGGFTQDRHVQTAAMVRKAASEVFGKPVQSAWLPWAAVGAGVLVLGTASFTAWRHLQQPAPVVAEVPAGPAPDPALPPKPEPPPAPPTLAQLLQQHAAATGIDGAWTRLFGLWNAQYTAGPEAACAQALRQGLECLEEFGGIESLRRFNRPAIVSIADASGAMHQAVLAQLPTSDTARLMVGDAAYDVAISELDPLWNGAFLLLWKPSQLDTRNLSAGMWGEPVRNLRLRLYGWAGVAPDQSASPPDYFDEELQELVMRFQANMAPSLADEVIGRRLAATADSILGETPDFQISRGGRPSRITIQTEYQERVELPLFHHTFVLRPRAEAPL